MLITHDLAVVAETAQRVIVMYAGKKVEEADVEELFEAPLHPYTHGLLASIPQLAVHRRRTAERPTAAEGDSRHGAGPDQPAARLLLRAALRVRRRRCPLVLSALRAEAAGPLGGLLAFGDGCMASVGPAWPRTRASPHAGPMAAARRSSRSSDLKKHFPVKKGVLRRTVGQVYAVDGVSFSIGEGETLGLVGESGCGKSTVPAPCCACSSRPPARSGSTATTSRGSARADDAALPPPDADDLPGPVLVARTRACRPATSSASRCRCTASRTARKRRRAASREIFDQVGLRRSQMTQLPARILRRPAPAHLDRPRAALNPKLIVADEPVSALDVSIQAQVINLMMDLQREKRLSYLFIAHDLAVVEHISHRIAVMYLGKIVEYADKETLFTNPLHPYTEALLSAVPVPNPKLKRKKRLLQGDVPSPINPPPGCAFHTRCPYAEARCKIDAPALRETSPGHGVSCHLR